MAQLISKRYSEIEIKDWKERMKAEGALIDRLDAEGKLFTHPIADGVACYEIISMKPLTLAAIPVGDAYQLPQAHIRGLRTADVKQYVRHNKRMNELFGKPTKG